MNKLFTIFVICLGLFLFATLSGCTSTNKSNAGKVSNEKALPEWGNKTCPIMGGKMEAEKKYFTVYEGKKVYFCCPGCSTKFNKNPDKYRQALFDDVKKNAKR